jgi:hypothetical protein
MSRETYIMESKIGFPVVWTKTGKRGYIEEHKILDGKMMYIVEFSDKTTSSFSVDDGYGNLRVDDSEDCEPFTHKFMLGELVCLVRLVGNERLLPFVGTIGIISRVFLGCGGVTVNYDITTEDGEIVEEIWEEELEIYSGPFRNPYKRTPAIKQDKKRPIEK